ncbi:hypothetical protein SPIRO4BDMA_50203 [uncultured spirochete]|uniref:DUF4143 domain-containing protein n=1 Tax=uncultured spirochete TaxID=156406 RepID=A0A3P3XQU7_9SPIR|nr:hypothetical protein SPIRO4BDMA_50203 [uncultured spirochete]
MRNNASDHSARLFPFFTHELAGNPLFVHASTDECLQRGWYPPLFDRPFIPSDWYELYVALYLEKDLSRLINIKDLSQFHKFISLCAGERFSFWHAPSAGEVDLVVEQGNDIRAIEIKSSATFRPELSTGLERWGKLASLPPERLSIVYDGVEQFTFKGMRVVPWRTRL